MKRFSIKKGAILLGILLVPSVLFLVFSLGKHHIKDVPVLGPKTVGMHGDTVYHVLRNQDFISSAGEAIGLSQFKGKVLVLDFFSSPCDDKCMKKGAMLANLQNEFKDKENFMILSISIDTSITQDSLAFIAAKHAPREGRWMFAKTENIEELVSDAFIGMGQPPSLSNLPVKEYILLDQQQRVRGYFDSRMLEENKKLEDAVKVLMREPFISHKEKKND